MYLIAEAVSKLGISSIPGTPGSCSKRVLATDGTEAALKGMCIFFVRPNNGKAITSANIADMLQSGELDASKGRSLLTVVREYLQLVMMPALEQGQNWGKLSRKRVDAFMSTFNGYINFLQSKS